MAKITNPNAKKPSTKKPASKKPAPKPIPVPVEPVETEAVKEETPQVDINLLLTKSMVMNYVEAFTNIVLGMKGQIFQTIVNLIYDKGEEEASEEYKAAAQLITNEVNVERDVRIITYEALETESKEGSALSKADAATYFLFKSIKEKLEGYNNSEISIENVIPTPGSNITFVVFKEAYLMDLAAKENILKAMGEDTVCGICLVLKEFPIMIIDIFRALLVAMLPSITDEDLEGVLEKYINNYGPAIAGLAIRTLATINTYFIQDPQGIFTNIVGITNIEDYYFKNVVNTTSPDKASLFEIHRVANSGDKSIEDAIKEA